ncbi:RusA family crossover junction endodeoxyribonuclease [Caloramator quimbayensis]|uniref:RusA family crossover junction endodeoxyribonuclease n=1 Tax=Caloramator quimbayensis TaxID=1147123 RepID=UPI00117797BB|nr:RusA family crossover junction endodeoxyribonuclease [Caloramator quimbayensis]
MKFIIPGEPKAKARPRMSTKTGIAYTPKETIQYENWVKTCFIEQGGNKIDGQISAKITAYYSIPKSTSKKKREEMLKGKIRPVKKPDVDNIVKSILDSLNKIAYDDDSQVVKCDVEKFYDENPRVEVELKEGTI